MSLSHCMSFQQCLCPPTVVLFWQILLIVLEIIFSYMMVIEAVFIFLQTETMFLFQKFHPADMGAATKLGNKALGEHGSNADNESSDIFLKLRSTPRKFHQPVRSTN